MITILTHLIVIVIIAWLGYWLLQQFPIPNASIAKLVNVLFTILIVLAIVFEVLLPMISGLTGYHTYGIR